MKNIILLIILIVYIIYTIRKTAQKKKIVNNTATTEKNETVTYEEQYPEDDHQYWEHLQDKESVEIVELSRMRAANENNLYKEEVYDTNVYETEDVNIETISQPQKTEPKQYMETKKESAEPVKYKEDEDKADICSMFKHKHMRKRELKEAAIWLEILAKPVSLRDE